MNTDYCAAIRLIAKSPLLGICVMLV